MQQLPQTNDTARFTGLWMKAQRSVAVFIQAAIRNHHDAEDILQETAGDAARHFDQYDPQRPFTPWVIGIARQRVADYYRKQSRERHVFDDDVLTHLARVQSDAPQEDSARIEALATCMKKLPVKWNTVLKLRYAQDMPPENIASRLATTSGAVTSLLYRIRKALRECIESHEQREARP